MEEIISEKVSDLGRIRQFLADDVFTSAYLLGNLDPSYQHFASWYVAHQNGKDLAVLEVYTGLSAPLMVSAGRSDAVKNILKTFHLELPDRSMVNFMTEHLEVWDRSFVLSDLRPMVRMGLTPESFLPSEKLPPSHYPALSALGHRDTGDIMQLYAFYPDHFFEPYQLSSGYYYGIRNPEGVLVSVAGIHVVSKQESIAALGNIVTHPDYRGQGLSTALTSHLVGILLQEGIQNVALNVERKNRSALRVYERLGFFEHCTYLEGFSARSLGPNNDSPSLRLP